MQFLKARGIQNTLHLRGLGRLSKVPSCEVGASTAEEMIRVFELENDHELLTVLQHVAGDGGAEYHRIEII